MSNDLGQYAELYESMLSYRLSPAVAASAIKTVCGWPGIDAREARTFLSMLGLDEYLPRATCS